MELDDCLHKCGGTRDPCLPARTLLTSSCFPAQVLEESKALVRCNMKMELEQANERECEALKKIWGSAQGMDSMLKYLQRKIDEF